MVDFIGGHRTGHPMEWLCELTTAHPIPTIHAIQMGGSSLPMLSLSPAWLFMVIYGASLALIALQWSCETSAESSDAIATASVLDALRGLLYILLAVTFIDMFIVWSSTT